MSLITDQREAAIDEILSGPDDILNDFEPTPFFTQLSGYLGNLTEAQKRDVARVVLERFRHIGPEERLYQRLTA